ncbi:MAG: dienelactone hydrolase [Acidimicrobiaceae bacterium]|nr:dienelactone hydrolase [Acidimicrobiaceae bacterium]MCY4281002.1 dienelactone hydrolase [Acidimicrobiaceae bacterium]MCY4295325.1 dienelactone hydrolase [Acidimicrobiaceae bacterium]
MSTADARVASAAAGPAGLLLTHGAGGGADHHTLVALQQALQQDPGLPVRRIEFSYRRQARRFPDRAPKLIVELRSAAQAFAAELGVDAARIVLGGRSLGGRVCSMAVSEGLPAAGLVLLSYPLHPPRMPGRLRVGHFGDIDVPVLFVTGDRDPFGSPEEFAAHFGAIAGAVTVRWLEGQNHDPKPAADPEIIAAVAEFLKSL